MFFNSKPNIYLQLLDRSIRYLAIHPNNDTIVDQGEIVFEAGILEDGHIINSSLLETRLAALVNEKKWKNAKAHVLLLNNFITVRYEKVPGQLTPNEIREYLNLHINETIRIPLENPSFDFEIVDQNEGEQEVFIIAYPSEAIRQYQEILQKASLKPAVADINALCLYRISDQKGKVTKEEDRHTLLLEWNPYDSSVMVFNQDRPIFNRFSHSPRLAEAWELTTKGKWDWRQTEQDLKTVLEDQINALERFLDFYRYSVLDGEGSVSEIILTGDFPNLEQLRDQLAERFQLNVKLLELPTEVKQSFGALYGLTLKEKIGGKRK